MKFHSRVSREESALAILFVVWGFAVAAFSVGARFYALLPRQYQGLHCPFKELFGIPCGTCGTTRVYMLAARGEFTAAVRMNPFMFAASVAGLILGGASLGAYAGLWGFPDLSFTERHKRLCASILILLFFANWIYLIRSGA